MANNDVIKGVVGPPGPAGPAPSGAGNLVLATPNGSSGTATLRALVLADLPALVIGAGTVTNFTAGNLDTIATTAVANPTTTPSLTFTMNTQTANTVWAGPTTGAAAAPTFRGLVAADFPVSTVPWSSLGNALANLTLSNAAFTTEFDQTSAVAWLWKNTTVATVSSTNASPLLEVVANYWATGAVSAPDTWSIQSSLTAGLNGISTLAITHAGSTGNAKVQLQTASVLEWSTDSGISRIGAAAFAFGNGTTGDFSGTATAKFFIANNGGTGGSFQFINANAGFTLSSSYIRFLNAGFSGAAIDPNANLLVSAGGNGNASNGTLGFNGTSSLAVATANISWLAAGSLAIGNGTAANTTGNLSFNRVNLAGADYAGQATITAASTTQAVTFAANYTGTAQPVIVITPTSDPLALGVPVGYWVTYSGGAGAWSGFTVNIQTALAGNVTFNYIVIGKA